MLGQGHPRRASRGRTTPRSFDAQGADRLRPHLRQLLRRRAQRLRRRSAADRALPRAAAGAGRMPPSIDVDDDHRARSLEQIQTDADVRRAASPSSSRRQGRVLRRAERGADRQRRGPTTSSSSRPRAGTSRERRKDKRMEDAIVKTVAAFLNTDGGTLLIGVDDDAQVDRPRPRLPARQAAERRRASSTG